MKLRDKDTKKYLLSVVVKMLMVLIYFLQKIR